MPSASDASVVFAVFRALHVQSLFSDHGTHAIGATLASTDIVGSGKYLNAVTAPNTDITYAYGTTIPAIGTLYLQASYASGTDVDYAPTTGSYSEW